MTDLARKLLAELRRMPDAMPAEALAEIRRRLKKLELAKGRRGERNSTEAMQ